MSGVKQSLTVVRSSIGDCLGNSKSVVENGDNTRTVWVFMFIPGRPMPYRTNMWVAGYTV